MSNQSESLPKIVLPEGDDPRVREAARLIIKNGYAHPILIGNTSEIASELGESRDYTAVSREKDTDPVWQGAQLVADGEADGIVAGAIASTADVLRAYIKTIGVNPDVSRVTSCFLMEKDDQRYLFADCGVNIDPSAEILAETAYLSHKFAHLVDIEPKIAFLSFSTKGSAEHETVAKMRTAAELAKKQYPELVVDGELQVDAALVPSVAKQKAPESVLEGAATILIFPDLNSGNIAYKLTERLGGFSATGPLLLGLAKPGHDLSRGCNSDDIVTAVKLAALEAKQ